MAVPTAILLPTLKSARKCFRAPSNLKRGAWSTGAQIGLDYARSHFKCDEFPPAVCGEVERKITMPDWWRIGGWSLIQCRRPELLRTDE